MTDTTMPETRTVRLEITQAEEVSMKHRESKKPGIKAVAALAAVVVTAAAAWWRTFRRNRKH